MPKHLPYLILITAVSMFFYTCSKDDRTGNAPVKSKEAKLLSLNFPDSSNTLLTSSVTGVIDEANKTVTLIVPPFTEITNLVASFTISDKATLQVGSMGQKSGVTANNFINPVQYIVVAEDGTKVNYIVTVTTSLSSDAKLIGFSFDKLKNPALPNNVTGTINETDKTVSVLLPVIIPVNALISSFTISAGATLKVGTTAQQNGLTPNNFTTPVQYFVTAQDGTTATYTITVTVPLSADNYIKSFKFTSTHNPGVASDIQGYITKNDEEIHLQNRYLTKNDFISSFTISDGATLKINNVVQTGGVSSANYANQVLAEVTAANGDKRTYKIKTTSHIVNMEDFLKECPTKDPNINQILADFEIREDGKLITNFPCTDPYYPMTTAQFNDQIKWLQTLRILFYLDRGQTNHLPWTNLRIYDWLKSKIGGINIQTNLNGGYCCSIFDGKNFIAVGKLKDNLNGNFAQIPDLNYAWSMNNFVLLLHEARHLDGFPHTNCCPAGSARCDNEYNLNNLSCYGVHIWWYTAVLSRSFDFGFDCAPAPFIRNLIEGTWSTMDRQSINFCTPPTIMPKPAYWNDCKYK